jgi:hypothetical protein
MSIAQQEFTNAGKSMLGRAQNAETLHISTIVVGSGAASSVNQLWPLTALIHQELTVNISATRDYGDGTLLVEGSFRSNQASHAFDLRELGVMAHVGAEADRLYSVANCLADPPDHVDPASPSVWAFKIKLIIDRIPTGQVTIQIGPTEMVLGENIGADTVGAGFYKEAVGNVLRFKRAKEGQNITITDEGDAVRFDVQSFTLEMDLDLYVPLTYPGAPPDAVFATVQAAHDYLLQWSIPRNVHARIHVAEGIFHHNGTLFNHPQAQQISLLGWALEDRHVTKIEYVSRTAPPPWTNCGVKKVTCTTTGLAVGQIVHLHECKDGWVGGCKIIEVQATYVLCTSESNTDDGGAQFWSENDTTSPNMTMTRFPTVLVCDVQDYAISNLGFPYGIELIENIAAEGGWAGCFAMRGSGYIHYCLAYRGVRGLACFEGSMTLINAIASGCSWGVVGPGKIFAPQFLYVNGCLYGVVPGTAGCFIASWLREFYPDFPPLDCYITACGVGVGAKLGACPEIGNTHINTCDTGVAAHDGSTIVFDILQSAYLQRNGLDAYASGMSFINLQGHSLPPGFTSNPPVNTLGNANSLIYLGVPRPPGQPPPPQRP